MDLVPRCAQLLFIGFLKTLCEFHGVYNQRLQEAGFWSYYVASVRHKASLCAEVVQLWWMWLMDREGCDSWWQLLKRLFLQIGGLVCGCPDGPYSKIPTVWAPH